MSFQIGVNAGPFSIGYTPDGRPGAPDILVRVSAYSRYVQAAVHLHLRLAGYQGIKQAPMWKTAVMSRSHVEREMYLEAQAADAMTALHQVRLVGASDVVDAANHLSAVMMAMAGAADGQDKQRFTRTQRLFGDKLQAFVAAARADLDPRPSWHHAVDRGRWRRRQRNQPQPTKWPPPWLEDAIATAEPEN